MASKKSKSWQKVVVDRVEGIRRGAEKQVGKVWERTLELLPPTPRKTVKNLAAEAERAGRELSKRRKAVVTDVRKRTDQLTQAVQERADRLTSEVQKRFDAAVTPITKRFDVASRADVDKLRKRLDQLEKRVATHNEHRTAAA